MRDVFKAGLRVAALVVMALAIAHCGDNDVRVIEGSGVSPAPGTFVGATGDGGTIVLEVGSIRSIEFGCSDEQIRQSFSPPEQVSANGNFTLRFRNSGRDFRVEGIFRTNDSVDGTIFDADNECDDVAFDATRQPGGATPVRTATPVGPTATPGVEPTETPAGGPTETPGPEEPTPTPTPAGEACPSVIEVLGNSGDAEVLDTGWTGLAHNATVVDKGKLTVSVTGCQSTTKPCGVCNVTGPIANVNAADYTAGTGTDINDQRCTGNSRTTCTSDTDCASAGGTCEFFFGSLLPLSAGGVSTCVSNQINGAISGTVNIETGASASTVKLISRVFSAPLTAQPCPRCEGDATPNDGVRGGTCDGGQNQGQTCDVNGSSPNVFFGETSLDCPPLSGGQLAALPIDLTNSTGTETRALSASSPNCRAPGFTSLKCFCDTCNNADATPCATDADCPSGGICGGKRCQGGSNNGNACTTNTECDFPSGACTVPGQATTPNACDDSTCVGGECSAGPFDQFCGPTADFQGCASDADCSQFAGNTCSIGEFRPCFTDNGASGASITATGQPDPFDTSGVADGKLAALFCIGPVASSAVNSAAGLPGLGRLELPTRAKLDP